jgi:CheY-like chemotaxis protein
MRKRHAILFDDEPVVLLVLKEFFERRGYEVLAFPEPVLCPVYGEGASCSNIAPCGDIMLVDYKMPRMNGIELLQTQARRGCRLTAKNKALLTGYMDDGKMAHLQELGAAFFEKPVLFDELGKWVDECEARMDLTVPLGYPRKEDRRDYSSEISYAVPASGDEICHGAIVNLSSSGLCIRVRYPLMREQPISIKTPLPISSPVVYVRWLREAEDGGYLAGLQCYARQ